MVPYNDDRLGLMVPYNGDQLGFTFSNDNYHNDFTVTDNNCFECFYWTVKIIRGRYYPQYSCKNVDN